ncbi:hypothetical protein pb186bvf_011763 [Paramecium bursaria]
MFQILFIVIFCLIVFLLLRRKQVTNTKIQKFGQIEAFEHRFIYVKDSEVFYCNSCSNWLQNRYECLICGIVVHKSCVKKKLPECKHVVGDDNHQWLHGNLPYNSVCSFCNQICSTFFKLEGASCMWCQRVYHDECAKKIDTQCDFGDLNDAVVKPSGKMTNPVIVLINKKSGGQQGELFYKSFNRYLNPIQVISIIDDGCGRMIKFKNVPNAKILACGGDGTIGSVINFMKLNDMNNPVGILPLGTGNDLSRVFGWGATNEHLDASPFIEQVLQTDSITLLDRWQVRIGVKQVFTMFNYFGIGLDAKFCYDFHELRKQQPNLFTNQFKNKFLYAKIGFLDLFKKREGLGKRIKLICDGKQVEVPSEVENLIVLNISSWGGGIRELWKEKDQFKEQKMNDGMMEVIGVTSGIHLGKIQIGLDVPYQIAQGKSIQVIYPKQSYIQIDGEPLKIGASTIDFTLIDKVQMLTNSTSKSTQMESKILRTMDWALENKLISLQGKNEILNRIFH